MRLRCRAAACFMAIYVINDHVNSPTALLPLAAAAMLSPPDAAYFQRQRRHYATYAPLPPYFRFFISPCRAFAH